MVNVIMCVTCHECSPAVTFVTVHLLGSVNEYLLLLGPYHWCGQLGFPALKLYHFSSVHISNVTSPVMLSKVQGQRLKGSRTRTMTCDPSTRTRTRTCKLVLEDMDYRYYEAY